MLKAWMFNRERRATAARQPVDVLAAPPHGPRLQKLSNYDHCRSQLFLCRVRLLCPRVACVCRAAARPRGLSARRLSRVSPLLCSPSWVCVPVVSGGGCLRRPSACKNCIRSRSRLQATASLNLDRHEQRGAVAGGRHRKGKAPSVCPRLEQRANNMNRIRPTTVGKPSKSQ